MMGEFKKMWKEAIVVVSEQFLGYRWEGLHKFTKYNNNIKYYMDRRGAYGGGKRGAKGVGGET
jgi:hypothetical protein